MAVFVIKKDDTRPNLVANLYDKYETPEQEPIDLTTASMVKFVMREHDISDPEPPKIKRECSISDPVEGVVVFVWESGDTDTVGLFNGEFEITWEDGGVETIPNKGYCQIEITDDLG